LSCADFDIWPLTWFAVAPLFVVLFHQDTKKPWFYGFLCGLTANGGGFYWIVGFLQRFGHLPLIAALPIFALLIGYQAITFALFAWIVRRLDNNGHPLRHGFGGDASPRSARLADNGHSPRHSPRSAPLADAPLLLA